MAEQWGAPVITRLNEHDRLGDYDIVSVAGTGGMGVVYRARQRSLGRIVALKVIREEIVRTPEYRQRFLREARLAASVDHPHVVSIYDVGDQDDQLFLAMQWIEGDDLKRLIEHHGRLVPDRAVMIVTQLAGALDAVHRVAGLVHRDVKPANVLLGQVAGGDHAYLTDFGVAKPSDGGEQLTQTGWVVGTAGYLSPEQIRGREPEPRSDLYALGCLFYEALTGQPPFRGDNEMALRWAHANDPRPTASTALATLGDRYDTFFATALAVEPEQRFASGREFASALAAAHVGEWSATATRPVVPAHTPTAVGPPTPIPPAHTPPPGPQMYPAYGYATPPPAPAQASRGNPLALILLGLVALAGIAVGALAAAGVFSHTTPTRTITSSSSVPAAVTKATSPATHHKPKPSHPAAVARPAAPGGATTSCGGDLSVGANTSCDFAQNVEQAYDQTSGGAQVVTAYSPATGNTYSIDCTGSTPHVCSGGTTHNASLFFTYGPSETGNPSASSEPSAPSSTAGLHACDQNIFAGSSTSCPFAENIFYEYTLSSQDPSGQTMTIYSPATQEDYAVTCTPDQQANIDCYSNTGSYTMFSQQSVADYTPAQSAAYAASGKAGNSNPSG
jgi:tRNA A-37 threonylcarbamoyl transferase component Bud32